MDVIERQFSKCLTFLYVLQIKALTTFLLECIFKDICIAKALENRESSLSREKGKHAYWPLQNICMAWSGRWEDNHEA
jgi:hypothetical protein